jgi:hydrogenase maturation factor
VRRSLDGADKGAQAPALPAPERETRCDANHCITCSDEAVPLRVLDVRDGIAVCEGDVEVMTDLVGRLTAGDVVLVHAGVALQLAEDAERLGP